MDGNPVGKSLRVLAATRCRLSLRDRGEIVARLDEKEPFT